MNGTFILEGLPGHKVEGITHVHLHHSKVIIPPVFLHACSKAMNNLLSSRGAGNSKLKRLEEFSGLVFSKGAQAALPCQPPQNFAHSNGSDIIFGIWRPGEVPYLMQEGSLCP